MSADYEPARETARGILRIVAQEGPEATATDLANSVAIAQVYATLAIAEALTASLTVTSYVVQP